MARKPTYEELEQKIRKLEKESARRKQAEEELRESEEEYRSIYILLSLISSNSFILQLQSRPTFAGNIENYNSPGGVYESYF